MPRLAERLREALRHPIHPSLRLEISVVEQGIRIQVSQQGARTVGCVVPWIELDQDTHNPLVGTIDRCTTELFRRHSVELPQPDPVPEPTPPVPLPRAHTCGQP